MIELRKLMLIGPLAVVVAACGGGSSGDSAIRAEDGSSSESDVATTDVADTGAPQVTGAPEEGAPVTAEPDDEPDDEDEDEDEARDVDAFLLGVGDCFDAEIQDEVESLPVVPCDVEHSGEVFHLFDLPDGAFPGADAVDVGASDGCLAAFEEYVGLDFESSRWDVGWLFPTEATWNQLDDREVVCLLSDVNGERVAFSAEGSGQ